VVALLPEADRVSFRIEALAELAATDPSGALEGALMLDSSAARRRAIEAIAAVSVMADPDAALAWLDRISDPSLNLAFLHSAVLTWAEIDPAASIEYLQDADAALFGTFGARPILDRVADREPALLLSAAGEFPRPLQSTITDAALRAIGEQNPAEAIALLEASSDPNERGALLIGIGANYARGDPDTALERVLALEPASRVAAGSVLNEIAQVDFDRAVAIALERPTINDYTSLAALPIHAHLERAPELAERLLAAGAGHESALGVLTRDWAMEQPDEALDWALANRASLRDIDFLWIATYTARRNAAGAAAVFERLPPEVGESWVSGLMSDFVQQDPAAASRFALNLPESPMRDEAIGFLIQTPLGYGDSIDVTVLDGVSSPAVRDDVIMGTDPYLRPANLIELEKLIPYISNPALRTQFEERLVFIR
jgi:hypothetical protein